MLKLSILIPVFNGENYIARCLDSVLSQNLKTTEYEIILVNDGSEDSSKSILESYSKKFDNIRLFYQANIGLGKTRDVLFSLAKGEYVYHLDIDDYLLPNTLDKVLATTSRYKVDVLGFSAQETFTNDYELEKLIKNNSISPKIISGAEFLLKNPNHRQEVWWYIVNRKYALENKYVFGKYDTNEDILYTVKTFIFARKVIFLPLDVHRYYQSPNSITRNTNRTKNLKMMSNIFLVIEDFTKLIELWNDGVHDKKYELLFYLKIRRDKLIRYFLLLMLKKNIGYGTIKNYVNNLEDLDIYPIPNVNKYRNKKLKIRFLDILLCSKTGLLLLSIMYDIQGWYLKRE